MSLSGLISRIDELKELVEGWSRSGEISSVERDLALERVKRIYEQLRFPIEVDSVVEPEPEPEPVAVMEEEPPVIEIEEHIEVVSIEVEPEPIVEPESEPVLSEDSKRKERRRKILSLYADESSEPEPVPEPEIVVPEPTPAPEPTPVFTPSEPQISLNDQLGFNDRLVIANDLFHGDYNALGRALTALDRLQSMDEALIYIAEYYGWNGNNDGARLLYSLLKSRYKR